MAFKYYWIWNTAMACTSPPKIVANPTINVIACIAGGRGGPNTITDCYLLFVGSLQPRRGSVGLAVHSIAPACLWQPISAMEEEELDRHLDM